MSPKYLVIVRRGEDALYAQWQEAGITVIWDRRYGERRKTVHGPSGTGAVRIDVARPRIRGWRWASLSCRLEYPA